MAFPARLSGGAPMTMQEQRIIRAAVAVSVAAETIGFGSLDKLPTNLLHDMFAAVHDYNKFNGCICRANTPVRNPECRANEHRP